MEDPKARPAGAGSSPAPDDAPLPWTRRLVTVLRKVAVPVEDVRVEGGCLVVDLDPPEGPATVRMSLRASGFPAYRSTATHDFSYRLSREDDARLLAIVDRTIAVLAHLEDRLPDFSEPVHGLRGGTPLSIRQLPFVSVDEGVAEDGTVHRQVLVRLTDRCNQNCPFCSAPVIREPSGEDLRRCLVEAPREFPGCLLTLTGGEPTLRPDFRELLALALAQPGIGGVQVQTNGVPLADPARLSLLPIPPLLTWFFSLHAVDPALYDRMTGTRGQFPRAVQGLQALVRAGHRVIVNVVVGSPNAAHLPAVLRTLPAWLEGLPLPEVHLSILMCPSHRPRAADWLMPYEDLLPRLEEAAFLARQIGLPFSPLVSSTHASIPPCFVSPAERQRMKQRPLVQPEETGYEDLGRPWVKARTCRDCPADPHCLGVPAPYARRFGLKGLRPYGPPPGRREQVVAVTGRTLEELRNRTPGDPRETGDLLVLDLQDPALVPPPDRPVSFRELGEALSPEWKARIGESVRVRSRSRPLCLFPESVLESLVQGGAPPRSADGSAFGPGCDECGLRPRCPGLSSSYLETFGAGELRPFPPLPSRPRWQDIARTLLTDRPEVRFPLHRLVPEESLPRIPCTRPWTRLELHDGGTYGPCCADYMDGRHFVPPRAGPGDLWQSDLLRRYRAAMIAPGHPEGCRTTCPVLRGRQETPDRLVLRGGRPEAVENQIRCVEALLEGRLDPSHTPLSFCVPVTSFCNYDCLMCECGEKGTLEDQRSREFWNGLSPWLDRGCELDVNGGEPLASPIFRAFVEDLARRPDPPAVAMVTNGSLLTPRWIASLPRLPFRAITVSLNAATPDTYRRVNRGLPFQAIRRNLDALRTARKDGRFVGGLTYSFVVLKANLAEVVAFARMGLEEGVPVRYLLPQRNRNDQSILTDPEAMREGARALREAATLLEEQGHPVHARDALVQAEVLEDRLEAGLFDPIGNP